MNRSLNHKRLSALAIIPVLAFFALGARLGYVQLARHEHYVARASGQHETSIPIRPKRGTIRTSDGEELAVSTPAYAVIIESRHVKQDHRALARRLSLLLGGSAFDLEQRLQSGRVFVLARKIAPRLRDRIELLRTEFGLSRFAIRFEEEGRRHYPHGTLASHVVGYVGLDDYGDNRGLEGIELAYDEVLRGSLEEYRVTRTASQKRLEPLDEQTYRKAFGADITLTLHSGIQFAAEEALARHCIERQAVSGACIVTEVKTGRILAAASYPQYDLNRFGAVPAEHRRNRVAQWAIEPGSVAKIFSIGLLLNERLVTPYTLFDCKGGRARINGRLIKDSPGHYLHVADIREIFKYSSNVGTNLAAQLFDPYRYYDGLRKFGLGERTEAGFSGETVGFLPNPGQWSGFTMTSLPMGYEMRVTPVQVAQAVGAVANGGVVMRPQIIEEVRSSLGEPIHTFHPEKMRRILDPIAAQQMLDMMELAVDEGTGTKAQVDGYRIGGKTGTTHKYDVVRGGYTPGMYYSSFAGVLPMSDPEILIYAVMDEPQGAHYGGSVAGPIFQEVAETVIRIRAIPADADTGAQSSQRMRIASVLAESATRDNAVLPAGDIAAWRPATSADLEKSVVGLNEPAEAADSADRLVVNDAAMDEAAMVAESAPSTDLPDLEAMLAMTPAERFEARRRASMAAELAASNEVPAGASSADILADARARRSASQNSLIMPDLTGLTLSEARQVLGEVELAWLSIEGSGPVTSHEPAPGSVVQAPIRVTLQLGFAPAPVETVAAEPGSALRPHTVE